MEAKMVTARIEGKPTVKLVVDPITNDRYSIMCENTVRDHNSSAIQVDVIVFMERKNGELEVVKVEGVGKGKYKAHIIQAIQKYREGKGKLYVEEIRV